MIYLQFILGFIAYIGMTIVSYSPEIKTSNWFFPIGIIISMTTTILWLWISKTESNPSSLVIKGLWWDTMLTLTYLIVPLCFYGAKLTPIQELGLFLIMIGLLFTKV